MKDRFSKAYLSVYSYIGTQEKVSRADASEKSV
jgi:hypothetical protein